MSDDDWGASGDDDDWESNLNIPDFNKKLEPECPTFADEEDEVAVAPAPKPEGPKKASGAKPKHAKKAKQKERELKIAQFEARRTQLYDDLGADDMDGDQAAELADNAICDDLFGDDAGMPAAGGAPREAPREAAVATGVKEAKGSSLKELLARLSLDDPDDALLFAKQFAEKFVETGDPIVIVGALKEVMRVIKPAMTSKDYQDLSSFATMQKNKKKKEEQAGVKTKKKKNKKKGAVAKTMNDDAWMNGGYDDYGGGDYDDFM